MTIKIGGRELSGPTLVCMVGLPFSGKTTWAKSAGGCPIVNPDSIRLALHGQSYIESAEPYVWAIAHTMVLALFLAGHNTVILDACNNTRKRREEWISEQYATVFKVIDTPAEVCLERAVHRPEMIPVIERMVRQRERFLETEGLSI